MKKQLVSALIAGLFMTNSAFALSADEALSDTRGDVIKDSWDNCILTHDGLDSCNKQPEVISLSLGADAFFDTDKYQIKPEGRRRLDQLILDLQKVELEAIQISGHTDSVGSAQYNQGLSERRARSVVEYLVQNGVDSNVITAAGYGLTRPIADNGTPEGRAQNRRVEIEIRASKLKNIVR